LYDDGGSNAVHGVMYILDNDIHISVGTSFSYDLRGKHGDWQSMGNVAGWYNRYNNSIVLNPDAGYESGEMPDTWGFATIIHEAIHLEQGIPLTKYKELEAMQVSIDVTVNLGGYYGPAGQQPSPTGRDGRVLALTLSHDTKVINEYSKILRETSFGYWIFYKVFLPIDFPNLFQ
jgi:hypothetical protein